MVIKEPVSINDQHSRSEGFEYDTNDLTGLGNSKRMDVTYTREDSSLQFRTTPKTDKHYEKVLVTLSTKERGAPGIDLGPAVTYEFTANNENYADIKEDVTRNRCGEGDLDIPRSGLLRLLHGSLPEKVRKVIPQQ